MKNFIHRHKFQAPSLSDIWKQVHTDIFVDGQMESVIQVECKCKKVIFKRVSVKLDVES